MEQMFQIQVAGEEDATVELPMSLLDALGGDERGKQAASRIAANGWRTEDPATLISRAWNEMQRELPRNGKLLCIEELLREKIFVLLQQEEMQRTMEPLQLSIVAA